MEQDAATNPEPRSEDVADGRRRISHLYRSLPRRARIAVAGYATLAVFGIAFGLARAAGTDPNGALLVAGLVAAPLVVAFIGERITGIKAFSFELSLSEVIVPVEGDFSGAVMAVAEMGPSASPELLSSFQAAVKSRSRALSINLRDDNYWWSSRIFLVAALAQDFTEVDALVFVRSGQARLFVGIACPRAVRTRLGTRFPAYEVAYRTIRTELAARASDPALEITEILAWRWYGAFQPSEAAAKQIVASEDLREWLSTDIDTESLAYGPLTPLLRYRITAWPHRYAALTEQSQLLGIVDRDDLARRIATAELEQRLR